ncbi:ABC transporter ATP-binding protein [Bosea sp. BK604]|uniref:ABC transporter ATP-binding protein n=1 Tax=Bosea sp. BK604 TaxID=2512180 RepID=UPI0010514E20|nr:ABC transporter ATP-binding protein [Bosea sp. BK604]TCR62547.1 NitT/TauT family transport system ATP-binding protein [Bosea sp. BK604]
MRTQSDRAIVFRDVCKTFFKEGKAIPALGPISFEVERSEFLAVLGASGCGKSTTLNMTAGLMKPNRGEVLFDGVKVTGINTKVGYLTQKDSLLPWRTVFDNVALPLEIAGIPRREAADRTAKMLAAVGLSGFEKHYPAEVSGGMRKRVGIARMLVSAPATLLLDEPFAALDAQLRGQLQQQLLDIWQNDRKTVVFVTHDLGEAVKLADRILVLSRRPGRVKGVLKVPLPRPRHLEELEYSPEFLTIQRELAAMLRQAESEEAA